MAQLGIESLITNVLLLLLFLAQPTASHVHHDQAVNAGAAKAPSSFTSSDPIPASTRAYWMKRAVGVLRTSSPCPFAAFAAVVVNHSDTSASSPLGSLVCTGLNAVYDEANPTLHGEVAAIDNCSRVLRGPAYNLGRRAALAAFADLTLYTTAEPCPMCAAAIRWAGFRECVYGTDLVGLVTAGWSEIFMSSRELFARSGGLGTNTTLVPLVLNNVTDPFFAWQYNLTAPCPVGCARDGKAMCVAEGPAPVPDPPVVKNEEGPMQEALGESWDL